MLCARTSDELKLDSVQTAKSFFETCFEQVNLEVETFWVAHINSHGRLLHLAQYTGNQSSVSPSLRSIISDLLAHDTDALLVAHNHPSGDARPSDTDLQFTRRLACVVEALDCHVTDHLIFGEGQSISFRQLGFL